MSSMILRVLTASCGNLELSRRDSDDPRKMKAKMALIREAVAEQDLG
jgi:hypothetical protein